MDEQIKINFEDEAAKALEAEKQEVVNKYKIGNPALLIKKEGKWFYKEEPVEEWFARNEELYSKDENEPYWHR